MIKIYEDWFESKTIHDSDMNVRQADSQRMHRPRYTSVSLFVSQENCHSSNKTVMSTPSLVMFITTLLLLSQHRVAALYSYGSNRFAQSPMIRTYSYERLAGSSLLKTLALDAIGIGKERPGIGVFQHTEEDDSEDYIQPAPEEITYRVKKMLKKSGEVTYRIPQAERYRYVCHCFHLSSHHHQSPPSTISTQYKRLVSKSKVPTQ